MYKTYTAREEVTTYRKPMIMKWMSRDTTCESALNTVCAVLY